jgi:hypothetical protein
MKTQADLRLVDFASTQQQVQNSLRESSTQMLVSKLHMMEHTGLSSKSLRCA